MAKSYLVAKVTAALLAPLRDSLPVLSWDGSPRTARRLYLPVQGRTCQPPDPSASPLHLRASEFPPRQSLLPTRDRNVRASRSAKDSCPRCGSRRFASCRRPRSSRVRQSRGGCFSYLATRNLTSGVRGYP